MRRKLRRYFGNPKDMCPRTQSLGASSQIAIDHKHVVDFSRQKICNKTCVKKILLNISLHFPHYEIDKFQTDEDAARNFDTKV